MWNENENMNTQPAAPVSLLIQPWLPVRFTQSILVLGQAQFHFREAHSPGFSSARSRASTRARTGHAAVRFPAIHPAISATSECCDIIFSLSKPIERSLTTNKQQLVSHRL